MTSSTHNYTGYYDPTTGKGQSGQMMKIGQNLDWSVYWNSSFPFINVIKGGYTVTNNAIPGTLDANGYPDASGGGSWNHMTHSPSAGWMAEGTVDEPWVLRWEGAGDVTWSGGTEIPGSTPNRREYTSLAVPAMYYTVATGDVTKLELLAPGEEARYDAGRILHSQFIADLAGIDTVRLMDPLSTNDNPNRDVSDFTPYDYINWNLRLSPNDLVQVDRGIPIQAACEIANELDANLHHNIPHQSTDAAVTYIGQQIALHFDFSGKKVKIELGNEAWNTATGFHDFWAWSWYGEAGTQEGTFDPVTATCTLVGHGMATGAEIACFNNIYHTDWPFAKGGEFYVIVDTVDTFRLSRTEAAALRGADVLDDTDPDYNASWVPDAEVTFLRFKQTALNTQTQGFNYATRAMEVWDLVGAEIGEENMEVVAGCKASVVDFMEQQLEVPGYRERVMKSGQFYIAPYWASIGIADDFENYTNEQHADYAIDVYMGDGELWHQRMVAHIEALGCYNFSAYECGNHNGNQGSISQEKVDKLISLARDTTHGTRITDHYFRRMSELGIKVATNYKAHSSYSSGDQGATFGSMEHQGDTDAPQYLGIKPFLDLGGVPK